MAEYIDREAVMNEIVEEVLDKMSAAFANGIWAAHHTVRDFPAADVAPVVRCKDCKNWGFGQWCETFDHKHEPDFYCAYGERREDG